MTRFLLIGLLLFTTTNSHAADTFPSLMLSPRDNMAHAPAVDLPTLSGKTIDSKDWAGHVVVLNFWATWCGPCKEEMPSMERLYRRLQARPFKLFAVTSDIRRQDIATFWQHLDLHFPVLLDEGGDLAQKLWVRTLPTTILIGPDGRIHGRAMGPRDWDSPEAVAFIEQLMGPF